MAQALRQKIEVVRQGLGLAPDGFDEVVRGVPGQNALGGSQQAGDVLQLRGGRSVTWERVGVSVMATPW